MILGAWFPAVVAVVAQYRHAGAIFLTVIVVTYIGVSRLGYKEAVLRKIGVGRRWRERLMVHFGRRNSMSEGVPVVIYGAGRRGKSILQELRDNRALGLRPIGFLDDDPRLIGCTRNHVRIIGSSRDLAAILNSQKVSALIISSHKITRERLVPVMSLCSKQRIPVLRGEFQLDRVSAVALATTLESSDNRQQVAAGPHAVLPRTASSHGDLCPDLRTEREANGQ